MDKQESRTPERVGFFAEFPADGVAIVVGGSGGIGKVVCERLAQCGCDVALTYRSNQDKASEVALKVERLGRRADSQPLDLTDAAAVERYYQNIIGRFGRIHTLVVASGPDIRMDYVSNITVEEWRETIINDLVGFFNGVKLVLPHLRQRGGSIVAISSAAIVRHSPMDILSTGPKGGVESVVRAIAREEGRYNIRANCVGLGAIDTGLMDRVWAHLPSKAAEAFRHGAPLRRMGTAEEAADAIVFLASNRSGFTTGQRLVVDGGYSI